MEIPLPHRAWWVTLKPKCDYDNNPLGKGKEFDKYNLNWDEEPFPELYVSPSFSREKLKRDPCVIHLKTVWYFTIDLLTRPDDEIDQLYTCLRGKMVGYNLWAAQVYTTRRAALADLAKCDRGVGLVFQAAKIRTGPIGALAKAVLAGDMSALPPLADALMEADHPLGEQVKELIEPPKKKGRSRKKK